MDKHDWATIQTFYDAGHTFRDITREFGPANETINRAVRNGSFIARPRTHRVKGGSLCRTCNHSIPPSRVKYCSDDCMHHSRSPQYEKVKNWRRNTKCSLVKAFGGQCGICRLIDHPVVYDFHHIDGSTKDFQIAQQIRAWSSIVNEAKKCVMLCAPCHRKHHAGILDIPSDIQRFDEELLIPL